MLTFGLLPEFECRDCTASQKITRGCIRDTALPLMLDGKELRRCPARPYFEAPSGYVDVLWLYAQYEKGHLPEGSHLGVYGQPNKMMQCFQIIDGALADVRKEKEDEADRAAGKPPGKRR